MRELTQPSDLLASASRLSSLSSAGMSSDDSTLSKIQKKYCDGYPLFSPPLLPNFAGLSTTCVDFARTKGTLSENGLGESVSFSIPDRSVSFSTKSPASQDGLTALENKCSQYDQNVLCIGIMDQRTTTPNAAHSDVDSGFGTECKVEEEINVTTMSPSLLAELCPANREGSNSSARTVKDAILSLASHFKTNDGHCTEKSRGQKRKHQHPRSIGIDKSSKCIVDDGEKSQAQPSGDVTTTALCQQEPKKCQDNSGSNNINDAQSVQARIMALVENDKRNQEEIKAKRRIATSLSGPRMKKPRNDKEPPQKQYFQKTDIDVIFGRGSGPNVHNRLFRGEVASRQLAYKMGWDLEKKIIVDELIEWVRNRKGRFLAKDASGWYEVTDSATRCKIRQMIRECRNTTEAGG